MEEFDAHQELLNDKIVKHQNTLKKLQKKEYQRKNKLPEPLTGPGQDYKRNAKYQIEVLEKKVEELERELFKIQEQKKGIFRFGSLYFERF